MITSIHQPSYFPWLGLLDKIKKSNQYIILDNVQFSDGGFQNRNNFINNYTEQNMLSIPIEKKDYLEKTIRDIKISQKIWQKKHSKYIYFNYKKHPYFDEVYPYIQKLFEKDYIYLIDAVTDSLEISLELLSVEVEIKKASEISTNQGLKKEELLIDILRQSNSEMYLSGTGAKAYQKDEKFRSNGISVIYQEFVHPEYSQYKNNDFIQGLSCLDLAFNLGVSNASKLL